MAALSKQLTNTNDRFSPNKLPGQNKTLTLSRQFQSELNLAGLRRIEELQTSTTPVDNGVATSIGYSLPNTLHAPAPGSQDSVAEGDNFLALQEIGAVVARRRGLKVSSFVEGLTMLLTRGDQVESCAEDTEAQESSQWRSTDVAGTPETLGPREGLTLNQTARRLEAQPPSSPEQKRQRHFSFEPGDDILQAFDESSPPYHASPHESGGEGFDASKSARLSVPRPKSPWDGSPSPAGDVSVNSQRPSKIPSSLQTVGRVRREMSGSSGQANMVGSNNTRHSSRSSVLTAFRAKSSSSIPPISDGTSGGYGRGPAKDPSKRKGGQSSSLRHHDENNGLALTSSSESACEASVGGEDSPARYSAARATTDR